MQYDSVKDSGERREFGTGAVRDKSSGKGRFDLLPPFAMKRLARHFENGAVKYAARNWEQGIPVSAFIDSGLRHVFAYLGGMRDEDHLAAAAWNVMCAIDTIERIARGILPVGLNDLPLLEDNSGSQKG